ncbi:MAG: hypothetical protein O2908_04940 [Verrucomicrobia bacterium]|jgi:hypothetical protein|nr:hypothetical protein [Verrucomicrobiota bacterium]MDA0905918.1 hypothetical protein [Verrucomicrobiota bacterium]MDA1078375.1 hypothetical protein [Verrucomicrobiota bacterium]
MSSSYKTLVVKAKGIRIKGDDTSSELALEIDRKSMQMDKEGYKLLSITPSLMSEGALIKVMLTFVKE